MQYPTQPDLHTHWSTMLYASAVIGGIPGIVFGIWGSAVEQEWANGAVSSAIWVTDNKHTELDDRGR